MTIAIVNSTEAGATTCRTGAWKSHPAHRSSVVGVGACGVVVLSVVGQGGAVVGHVEDGAGASGEAEEGMMARPARTTGTTRTGRR